MLSDKRKQEVSKAVIEAKEIIIHLAHEGVPKELNLYGGVLLGYLTADILVQHTENLVKYSENLVKQSKALTRLTITLGVLAFAQILLFIAFR